MTDRAQQPSTPHLFIEAMAQLAALFRTEIRLVRTELSEKAAKAVNAVGMVGGAVVLLFLALLILLEGLVAWLVAEGLPPYWAAVAVGLPIGIIGIALLLAAMKALKAANFVPDRALEQVSKDMAVAKEVVR
jgi:protein-S-isoprenylcysteine O-methyltransferase Ste14